MYDDMLFCFFKHPFARFGEPSLDTDTLPHHSCVSQLYFTAHCFYGIFHAYKIRVHTRLPNLADVCHYFLLCYIELCICYTLRTCVMYVCIT